MLPCWGNLGLKFYFITFHYKYFHCQNRIQLAVSAQKPLRTNLAWGIQSCLPAALEAAWNERREGPCLHSSQLSRQSSPQCNYLTRHWKIYCMNLWQLWSPKTAQIVPILIGKINCNRFRRKPHTGCPCQPERFSLGKKAGHRGWRGEKGVGSPSLRLHGSHHRQAWMWSLSRLQKPQQV